MKKKGKEKKYDTEKKKPSLKLKHRGFVIRKKYTQIRLKLPSISSLD